jgi:hypothetical protein
MFGLFKKKNNCDNCNEHNDLERLKQLQEYRASLSKEMLAIEDPRKVCLYDIIRENHRCSFRWDTTSGRAEQLGKDFADLVWHSMTGKYKSIDAILQAHFRCPTAVVEQIVNYLNGYLEWSRKESEYYDKIGRANAEINELKDKLGIE